MLTTHRKKNSKPRLLLVGCGDVLQRALPWLVARFQVYAIARRPEHAALLRAAGVRVIAADLDQPATLRRLAGVAQWLIHGAPPPGTGAHDTRTQQLAAALSRPRRASARATRRSAILAQAPRHAVYISTTGVYGNSQGGWLDETWPLATGTARAQRRVHAEQTLRAWARRQQIGLSIARAPGIYAAERLPLARIQRAEPALRTEEDSWSNHIHANDLARTLALMLFRGRPLRTYNVVDNQPLRMADWFDRVADYAQLPRPPRISREQAQTVLSPALLSYLSESRRIRNQRLTHELRVALCWPDVDQFIGSLPKLALDQ